MSDDRLARLYLLGALDDVRRAEVEERLLTEDSFAAIVEAVERDLFDTFAAGQLDAAETPGFRRYLESHPDASKRMRFSRALAGAGRRLRPSRRWFALAAAAAVVMAAGLGYLRHGAAPEENVIEARLRPGALRSDTAVQTVTIRPGAAFAVLALTGSEEARGARVRFIDSGQEVWSGEVSRGAIRVPAASLAAGDHLATTLSASGEELEDYVFRVMR